jgi:Amt family ammonium transporter
MSTIEFDSVTAKQIADITEALDTSWLVLTSTLVFFMQAGFMLVEVGGARVQHATGVLLKNYGDSLIVSMVFLFSYGLAFGDSSSNGGFIGTTNFFISDEKYAFWFFQSTFASAAVTIISGCILERVTFGSYYVVAFWMSLLVYPCVCHW